MKGAKTVTVRDKMQKGYRYALTAPAGRGFDPRGWFQWYCRYYQGRRLPGEDEKQIRRWSAMRRHIAQVKKHCRKGDATCRARQRQALLHWAYDSRTY